MPPKYLKTTPDLNDLLDMERALIFDRLNCVKLGQVQAYDKTKGTVSIQIQSKKIINQETGQLVSYPLLTDCPVYVAQGGGAFLEFPIVKGDDCIVLFNDTDMDIYWATGNVTQPNSFRTHDLSDGLALVGFNKKISPVGLSSQVRLVGGTYTLDLVNNFQKLSALMDSLLNENVNFVNAVISIVTTGGQSLNPATIAALNVIVTAYNSIKTNFDQLLGST